MHVLIRTFGYPSVAQHADRSQMLCAEEGHATARGPGLPHATALEASLRPAQEGAMEREESSYTLAC